MPSHARKITIDTVVLFLARVIGLGLSLLRLKYLATYLNVELFGIYFFATSFVAMFAILFDLGLPQILTREIAIRPLQSQRYLYNALILKVLLIFFTSLLIVATTLISHFSSITNWAIILTIVCTALNSLSSVFSSAFQANQRMKLVSMFALLNDIITSLLVIVLLILGYDILAILAGTVIVSMIILFVNIRYAMKLLNVRIAGVTEGGLWKYLFRESYPSALSSAGVVMYLHLSLTILKYLKGDEIVGYYGAALKIITILTIVPASFSQVVFPLFAELFASRSEKLRTIVESSVRYLLILSMPLSIGTIIIADKLMVTLFTANFQPAVFPLKFLMVANLFSYPNWLMFTFLTSINRQRFQMYITLGMGILVAITNYFLIPRFEMLAPSVSLMLVEIVLFFAAIMYLWKIGYHLHVSTLFFKPTIACLVMALIVYSARLLPMSAQIIFGIISYGLTFLLLRGIAEQDRVVLEGIVPSPFLRLLGKLVR